MVDNPCSCATWGNHCLCEWCCPNNIENMFCTCARNSDDMIEPCTHDTRLPQAREFLMKDVIEELERLSNQNVGTQYRYALGEAIALIKTGVDGK